MDRVTQNLVTDFLKNYELKSKDDSFDFERFANYSVIKNIFNNDFQIEEISTGKNQGIDGWVRCTLAGNIPYYSRWIHPLLLDGFDTLDSAIAKLDLFIAPVKFYHYNGTILKDDKLKVIKEGKQSKGGLNTAPTTPKPSGPSGQRPRKKHITEGNFKSNNCEVNTQSQNEASPIIPSPCLEGKSEDLDHTLDATPGIFYTTTTENFVLSCGDRGFCHRGDAIKYLSENDYVYNMETDGFEKVIDGKVSDVGYIEKRLLI